MNENERVRDETDAEVHWVSSTYIIPVATCNHFISIILLNHLCHQLHCLLLPLLSLCVCFFSLSFLVRLLHRNRAVHIFFVVTYIFSVHHVPRHSFVMQVESMIPSTSTLLLSTIISLISPLCHRYSLNWFVSMCNWLFTQSCRGAFSPRIFPQTTFHRTFLSFDCLEIHLALVFIVCSIYSHWNCRLFAILAHELIIIFSCVEQQTISMSVFCNEMPAVKSNGELIELVLDFFFLARFINWMRNSTN